MTQPPHGDPTPPEASQHPPVPSPQDPPAEPRPTAGETPPDVAGAPSAADMAGAPGTPGKGRTVLISIVLVIVVLMCAGGGVSAWLLLRSMEASDGAPDPGAAVTEFLDAVYTDKDADRAADLVCSEARDAAEITKKVAEVKEYEDKYESPTFDWSDPEVSEQTDERAIVTIRLKVTTADEKTAEQQLRFTVVKKTGWWVCEVA